jgi:hypothetical protein
MGLVQPMKERRPFDLGNPGWMDDLYYGEVK